MPWLDSSSVEFTVPAQQFTLSPGPCERCYAEVCFEYSTIRVTTCRRPVPVKWRPAPTLPECLGLAPGRIDLVPIEWEYRRFITSSHAQEMSAGSLVVDNPNTYQAGVVRYDLPEDHDSGSLRTLAELPLDQIRHLGGTTASSLSPPDFQHQSTTMVEVVAGHRTFPICPLEALKEKLDSLISAKLASPATCDLDGDGRAAPEDALTFFDAQRKAENGEPWDRRVDLNGDATPSLEDLCFLVSHIYR